MVTVSRTARGHLAGKESVPDKFIQFILVVGEIFLNILGRVIHIRGTDGFVRVLRAVTRLVKAAFFRIIVGAIRLSDIGFGAVGSNLRNVQRVGTHVGDDTVRAVRTERNTFIQLLRGLHGLGGREAETLVCLLLERGGDERRRGILEAERFLSSLTVKRLGRRSFPIPRQPFACRRAQICCARR